VPRARYLPRDRAGAGLSSGAGVDDCSVIAPHRRAGAGVPDDAELAFRFRAVRREGPEVVVRAVSTEDATAIQDDDPAVHGPTQCLRLHRPRGIQRHGTTPGRYHSQEGGQATSGRGSLLRMPGRRRAVSRHQQHDRQRLGPGARAALAKPVVLGIDLAVPYHMPPWFQLRFGVRLAALLLSSLAHGRLCSHYDFAQRGHQGPAALPRGNVCVAGVVTYSGSISGRGLYRIGDGEAELWVASTSGVPPKGTRVIVAGRIYDAYDVRGLPLPLPSSVANGVLLLESSRATE
jgi:hypothetical protein